MTRKYMAADFRGDTLDRNLQLEPTCTHRCELCWKPLKEKNTRHIIVTDDFNLTLPNCIDDIPDNPPTFPVGRSCYTKLRKWAKQLGFIVKVKK